MATGPQALVARLKQGKKVTRKMTRIEEEAVGDNRPVRQRFRAQPGQAVPTRGQPDPAVAVFQQTCDLAQIRQPVLIRRITFQPAVGPAAKESTTGADPQIPTAVLQQRLDGDELAGLR